MATLLDNEDPAGTSIDPVIRDLTLAKLETQKEAHGRHDDGGSIGPHEIVGEGDAPKRTPSTTTSDPASPSAVRKKVHWLDSEPAPEPAPAPAEPIFPIPPPPPPPGAGTIIPEGFPLPPPPPPGARRINLYPFNPALGPDGKVQINENAIRIYHRFMDRLGEFVKDQDTVMKARVQVQQERVKLKMLRAKVSQCDQDFIQYVRSSISTGTVMGNETIVELLDASDAARDEAGPHEMEYEELELKLGAKEYALEEKYEALVVRFRKFFNLEATSTTVAPDDIDFEFSDSEDGREVEELEPREYMELYGAKIGETVKVGQHPIKSEAHAEVLQIEGPVSPPSKGGILTVRRTYGDLQNSARPRPAIWGNDEEMELGHPDPFHGLHDGSHLSTHTRSIHGMSTNRFHSALRHPEPSLEELQDAIEVGHIDRLLLLGDDADTMSTLSDYLMTFESTQDRVNRWLLHKLRVSSREVLQLRQLYATSPENVDDWTRLALRCLEEAPTSDITQPPELPDDRPTEPPRRKRASSPYPAAVRDARMHIRNKRSVTSQVANAPEDEDTQDGSLLPPDLLAASIGFETVSRGRY